eukprot:COSAG06_NODE_31433_length_521_cov_2.689573_2_plen_51_part_01
MLYNNLYIGYYNVEYKYIYKQSLRCDDNPAVGEAGWRALATALPHLQVRFC